MLAAQSSRCMPRDLFEFGPETESGDFIHSYEVERTIDVLWICVFVGGSERARKTDKVVLGLTYIRELANQPKKSEIFTAYSFDGAVIVGLLLICTCAYLKRVPRVNSWLLSEKKGFFGIFYKVSALWFYLYLLEQVDFSLYFSFYSSISKLLLVFGLNITECASFQKYFQAAVIGIRLHFIVSFTCLFCAGYILFIR
ncbi:unnamed protein product [Onchocerca flexuosa]|uniref:Protein kish-B n=1 Tax=Onchocerca flexuosa TaxID=387005 RepID=A0A183I2D0_9BILA|nr:unnamed protein product [Onchocerca flexuosa]